MVKLRRNLIKLLGGHTEDEIEFFRSQLSREQERADNLETQLFQTRHPEVDWGVSLLESEKSKSNLRPIKTAHLPWNQLKVQLERSDRENMTKEKKDGIPT